MDTDTDGLSDDGQAWSKWHDFKGVIDKGVDPIPSSTLSLQERCCVVIAKLIPFQLVRTWEVPVPDHSQLSICFNSFPSSIAEISMYSCLANGQTKDFQDALYRLSMEDIENQLILNVLQIGFTLSADVLVKTTDYYTIDHTAKTSVIKVSLIFDRCKITSVWCSCEAPAGKWCKHIILLCLYRIKNPNIVRKNVRLPVSDTLSNMDRDSLQKFAQYLLQELPRDQLPTVQGILDRLLDQSLSGEVEDDYTLDPTAGNKDERPSEWYLEEKALQANIKANISKFHTPAKIATDIVGMQNQDQGVRLEFNALISPFTVKASQQQGLWNLLDITKELIRRNDSNGMKLLETITKEIVKDEQIPLKWHLTKRSAPFIGPRGNKQRNTNNSDHKSYLAACLFFEKLAEYWAVVLVDAPEALKYTNMLKEWQSQIVDLIRKERSRTRELEHVKAFGEALAIQEAAEATMKCRSLLARGFRTEAIKCATEIAQDLLLNTPDLTSLQVEKETSGEPWRPLTKTRLRQSTAESIKFFSTAEFIVRTLCSCDEPTREIAFNLGLAALAIRRPAAISKADEVKLFYYESLIKDELGNLNPLASPSMIETLRDYASRIITATDEGWLSPRPLTGHTLPITLASFIFSVLDGAESAEDKELGFWAAITPLSFKLTVSEAEYPLLCEGTRKLKGELVLKLLVRFKDDPHTLGTILEKFLDKTIAPSLHATSVFAERRTTSPVMPTNSQPLTPRAIQPLSSADESPNEEIHGRKKSNSRRSNSRKPRSAAIRSGFNSSASEEAMLSDEDIRFRYASTHARPGTPISSEGARESDSSSDNEEPDNLPVQPANVFFQIPNAQARSLRRDRSCQKVPDVPNAPSESEAMFYFRLAKDLKDKFAGGQSEFLMTEENRWETPELHKNLHLASFEIGLYARGIYNCWIGPKWMSCNWNEYGTWVTTQARAIGSVALDVLVTCWEGHLTCSETVNLAQNVRSKSYDKRWRETQRAAADLALSCLSHASSLRPDDINICLTQCRVFSHIMLEKGCAAVEKCAQDNSRDGPIPEALFQVMRQWDWMYQQNIGGMEEQKGPPGAPPPDVQMASSRDDTKNVSPRGGPHLGHEKTPDGPLHISSAMRTGLLALHHICRRASDDRGVRIMNTFEGNVMKLLEICALMGQAQLDVFCQMILKIIPHLKENCSLVSKIANAAAREYSKRNHQPIQTNLQVPIIRQLILKSWEQWQCIILNSALRAKHPSGSQGNDALVELIRNAQQAFILLPEGYHQFQRILANEPVLQQLNQSQRNQFIAYPYQWQVPPQLPYIDRAYHPP